MFRSNIKFFLAFFVAAMLFAVVQAYAVWQDAPAAPAQYGTAPGATQDDYKPVNLGGAVQTKTGGLNIGGNVGIGTTTPGTKLHVDFSAGGYQRMEYDAGGYSGLEFHNGSAATGYISFEDLATDALKFYVGGGAGSDVKMAIQSSGNVGIGTISPYAKLQIDMQSLATTEGLHISRTSPTSYSYLNIEDENSSPIFKVHQSGNVGIGTTTPAYKLGVVGNISATQLCIAGDCKSSWSSVVSSNTPNLQAVTDIGTSTTNVIGAKAFYDSDDPNRNYFIDPNAVGNSAVLRGNVTVGGTLDAVTLKEGGVAVQKDINSNCGVNQYIQAIADNGAVTCVYDQTGSGADNLGNHIATQNIQLNNNWLSNDGDNEGITINDNGNVGIGATDSVYLLNVAGATRLNGTVLVPGGYNVGITGALQANSFTVGYVSGDQFSVDSAGNVVADNNISASTIKIEDANGNSVDIKTYIAQLLQPFTLTLNSGCNIDGACLSWGATPGFGYGARMQASGGSGWSCRSSNTVNSCAFMVSGYSQQGFGWPGGSSSGNRTVGTVQLPINHGLSQIGIEYQIFGVTDDTPYARLYTTDNTGYSYTEPLFVVTRQAWQDRFVTIPVTSSTRTIAIEFYGIIVGGSNSDGMVVRFTNCNDAPTAVCSWNTENPVNYNVALF